MSASEGAGAVVAEAVSGVRAGIAEVRAAAAGEPLELFPLPGRRAPLDFEGRERAIEARTRGRPPGAVNKSTKAMREWLLAKGVNPLQQLMTWSMHTPRSLAHELGCSVPEAFDRLVNVWRELAPYFASKMAPVDDEGRPVPFLAMNFGLFGAPPSAGGRPPWQYLEAEQNQGVAALDGSVSHGDVSHETQKPSVGNALQPPSS